MLSYCNNYYPAPSTMMAKKYNTDTIKIYFWTFSFTSPLIFPNSILTALVLNCCCTCAVSACTCAVSVEKCIQRHRRFIQTNSRNVELGYCWSNKKLSCISRRNIRWNNCAFVLISFSPTFSRVFFSYYSNHCHKTVFLVFFILALGVIVVEHFYNLRSTSNSLCLKSFHL